MNPVMRTTLAAAAALGMATVALPAVSASEGEHKAKKAGASKLHVVGLAKGGTALVKFKAGSPEKVKWIGNVRGMSGDTKLVGIDYRVQDSALYGLGNSGGIYKFTGKKKAQKVSQLTVALQGTKFDIDFNPAANALRVVSNSGQNLRHPFAVTPAGPTVSDVTLTYPPSAEAVMGVTGAGYTNNDLDPMSATALFDIDAGRDWLATQNPANNGTLQAVGALGKDAGKDSGFDIYSTLSNGVAVSNTGWAVFTKDGKSKFFGIDLVSGVAKKVGKLPVKVTDIAIPLNQ